MAELKTKLNDASVTDFLNRISDEEKYPESEEEIIEDKQYDLKSIIDAREHNGVKQYQCKWVGHRAASWEPASERVSSQVQDRNPIDRWQPESVYPPIPAG